MPRVGLNPYALGMRLFYYIEELAEQGQIHQSDSEGSAMPTSGSGSIPRPAKDRIFIFKVARNFCDFIFISTFVDQDFVDRNRLFVAGKRLNRDRMVWEYFVKSRKAEDYRQMLLNSLYHPPHITIDREKRDGNVLYLVHHFEGKPLVKDFIANTMLGIEYLWGGTVKLETSEVIATQGAVSQQEEPGPADIRWERVVYTMKDRKLAREVIDG